MNQFDLAKLLQIAKNLSDYGIQVSSRTTAVDREMLQAMGAAYMEISEAIGDLATELASQRS